MKNTLLICLFLFFVSPIYAISAEMHTMEIEFSFSAPDDPARLLSGYRLYQEGQQVCQTADTSETSEPGIYRITCGFMTDEGTFDFSLTALYSDGSESPQSPSFPFTITASGSTPNPEPLLAVITTQAANGNAPFNISLDGTDSTGEITSYSWNFGDGTTGTGSIVNHTYLATGTYTATLQVTDQTGASNETTLEITSQLNPSAEPPTAGISTSTPAGFAPLDVILSGSSSSTPNALIVSYSWNFGDGSQAAIGTTTSHTYTAPGTYYPQLTVVDNTGQSDTVNIPIVVNEVVLPENQKAIASIISSIPSATDPLTYFFDASQSYDPDGTITQYNWNFGDGTTGSGQTVYHSFASEGVYTITLDVTDNDNETTTETTEVDCESPVSINIEVGEVTLDHNWTIVNFENSFTQPVVIAGPPTENGNNPAVVRVRNITPTGFEARIQEWDYLDGKHYPETFSYIVIEQGIYTLENGSKLEAGYFNGSNTYNEFFLQQFYDEIPVILTQVATENETDAVTGRVSNISENSFEFKLQEMESTSKNHAPETIGYIAWQPGSGEVAGMLYEVGVTRKNITHRWYDLDFETAYPELPFFIAEMQTCDGGNTATIRYRDLSETAIAIHLDEEQSKDSETKHIKENVGYLTIGAVND